MIIYNPEIVSYWIVSVVFIAGGIVNVIGFQPVRKEFERWGLKPWVRVLTGLSELTIAFLLITNTWLIQSLIISAIIMLSAIFIVVYNNERSRAWLPSIVLLFILIALSFHL